MAKRSASGAGSVRKRADGRWEARISMGRNPLTGKLIRKSIFGKAQAEVLAAMQDLQAERNKGIDVKPSNITVGAWLDKWVSVYLIDKKQGTRANYEGYIASRIKPALGSIKMQNLKTDTIQAFYNGLLAEGLSPKTVRNIHGVLHTALQQAVELDYLRRNPTDRCVLPRWQKKDVQVLDDNTVAAFIAAISGTRYEALYFVDLLTGMRQSEIMGLCWDCVNFENGTIRVQRQLLKERKKGGAYYLDDTTKNKKERVIKPAPIVMNKLQEQKRTQTEWQLRAGAAWCNQWSLVFTDECGGHFAHRTVLKHFKALAEQIGQPTLRFHDLRHSYAVASLRAGDDIKILQENLGHHSPAFTLGTYAHVTEQMRDESAEKMQNYINKIQKAVGRK